MRTCIVCDRYRYACVHEYHTLHTVTCNTYTSIKYIHTVCTVWYACVHVMHVYVGHTHRIRICLHTHMVCAYAHTRMYMWGYTHRGRGNCGSLPRTQNSALVPLSALCVCVCVRACVRAYMCVCVCVLVRMGAGDEGRGGGETRGAGRRTHTSIWHIRLYSHTRVTYEYTHMHKWYVYIYLHTHPAGV